MCGTGFPACRPTDWKVGPTRKDGSTRKVGPANSIPHEPVIFDVTDEPNISHDALPGVLVRHRQPLVVLAHAALMSLALFADDGDEGIRRRQCSR